jgi:hypothetical protein
MHPTNRFIPALLLVVATGCGGGDETALLVQRIKVLESQIERLGGSVQSCRAGLTQVEAKLVEAGFQADQVPNLVRDVESLKAQMGTTSKAQKDGFVVLPGVMVTDEKGNPRCLLTSTGLAILDSSGRRVGELQYDEAAQAATASLRGYGTKSVALYAGKDRVALGAYDSRADRPVGWAATVTPEGEVSVGRSGPNSVRNTGRNGGATNKRTRPVSK